jgi:group I intron endonuclease
LERPLEKGNIRHLGMAGIYVIRCSNGSAYIGQASKLSTRLRGHIDLLRRGESRNPPMQAAWNKYGQGCFSFEILEIVGPQRDALCAAENWWFTFYRAQDVKLFNICPIAESQLGSRRSEEFKQRLSDMVRGRRPSEETKKLMSVAHLGNTVMNGRKLPDSWRQNIGRASTGRRLTPGQLRKRGMAKRRRFAFNSPDERKVVIFGLNDFCLHNGLHLGAMMGVHSGRLPQHKGWRRAA